MLKIKQLFRKDYASEDFIKDLVYLDQGWAKTVETVTNRITNDHIATRAVVMGNGPSRLELNPYLFSLLANHKGGLLASGKMQIYGCNALIRDFIPDFLVVSEDFVGEAIANKYYEDTITYTGGSGILDYPGKFYLTPQNPAMDAGAIAAYLACFDGYKQIYLMGFDNHCGENLTYNVYAGTPNYPTVEDPSTEEFFVKCLSHVMDVYPEVEFIRVMPTPNWYMPEQWKYYVNMRQITFREFTLEVDL